MVLMRSLQNCLRRNPILHQFLLFFRMIIIIGCLVFVCIGWTRSTMKYVSGQTSISNVINETDLHRFPSISFCPKFRYHHTVIGELEKIANATGIKSIDEMDFDMLLSNMTWKREDFLTFFSHPHGLTGNPANGLHVLNNDSLWETTIPHPLSSGRCFTYNPDFESLASKWFGVRFGIKLPGTEDLPDEVKVAQLQSLKIFIHEPGHFMFYEEDDRPHSHKLDVSWLKLGQENSLSLKYSKFTSLSKDDRICTNDEVNYVFGDCVKKKFDTWRGCQAPWDFKSTSPLPVCNNIRNISRLFSSMTPESDADISQSFYSTLGLSLHTQCSLPCTVSKFEPHISSYPPPDWYKWMDNGADWIVYLWFKNYQFQYDTEYVVCDSTCLLGEIGGNLGFFLGGSVLAYMNTIVQPLLNG
ncbi:uncharacterized protein LOC131892296 [Tigriopus californicus]|uniref:uncharacterized protein LOC131892296 n=1 Tax=Tigriopus californicus TaxID=6832 RepID=UPI0027DA1EC6|nr:uncharacterized protein LOC131892296 [Tigriopus californicus]